MQPIEPDYTKATFEQANRVQNQLANRLTIGCEFDHQGSVTNDTHIKAKSDIDLLTIIERFFTLEPPQTAAYPYEGDPVADLRALRGQTITSLKAAFPEATVDTSGAKSVSIEGGSLRRKIDVVPCNWYDTNKYAETGQKVWRGIQILDANRGIRIKNTPFLHNAFIDQKDRESGGGFRKAARLMKSVKYDAENVDLSSYDIVAIAFNISSTTLNVPREMELSLLEACVAYCNLLENNATYRDSLYVPDGHRKVFGPDGATAAGLSQLSRELNRLATDVLSENRRSFAKLAEARVSY